MVRRWAEGRLIGPVRQTRPRGNVRRRPGRSPSLEAAEPFAVRLHRIDPCCDEQLHAGERIADRQAGVVIAQRQADWPLAVLVDHDTEASNERIAVMEVEGTPRVAESVEQLVLEFAPLVCAIGRWLPDRAEPGRSRMPSRTSLRE